MREFCAATEPHHNTPITVMELMQPRNLFNITDVNYIMNRDKQIALDGKILNVLLSRILSEQCCCKNPRQIVWDILDSKYGSVQCSDLCKIIVIRGYCNTT